MDFLQDEHLPPAYSKHLLAGAFLAGPFGLRAGGSDLHARALPGFARYPCAETYCSTGAG